MDFIALGMVLLVCRELLCWYWKINHIGDLLELDTNLRIINNEKKEI